MNTKLRYAIPAFALFTFACALMRTGSPRGDTPSLTPADSIEKASPTQSFEVTMRETPTPRSPTPQSTPSPVDTPPAGQDLLVPLLDISYYSQPPGIDPKSTSLDIYPPLLGEGHPVMIYVHGGGWRIGDKANVHTKPEAFNKAGFVFISLNYRLIPEGDVPNQAGDIARGIAWVVENISSYGGDPESIFLMGHSAGAHLVSLVSTDPTYLEGEGLTLEALGGVVALDTQAYNIPYLMSNLPLLGGRSYRMAFSSEPSTWELLSPFHHILEGRGIPPFLVAYSGSGEGRATQSEQFVERLLEVGFSAELLPATDKTHSEINRQFGLPSDAVTKAVFAFLESLTYNH